MVVKDYATPEAAPERYTPFYVREIDHLITSGQCQIDEVRYHAKLCERNLTQKSSGCSFQASRALPTAIFMIQTRQDIGSYTGRLCSSSNAKIMLLFSQDVSFRIPISTKRSGASFLCLCGFLSSRPELLCRQLLEKRKHPGFFGT